MNFHEILTKKYAGLPGWAWLLVGVAGVGIGYYFIHKQSSSTASAPATLTAASTPDLTTANTTSGTVGNNGTINNPFPETSVNGNQVPIIPPGYQAIYDNNGNIVGYEPIPPSNTSTPGNNGSGNAGSGSSLLRYIVTKAGASLETTPHDIGGGKNLLSLPSGAQLMYVSGPIPDPKGGSKQYYQVSYQGQTGWVGSDAIKQDISTGGGTTPPTTGLVPQSLSVSQR